MDLHGGDPQDVIAIAEYEEIKERVTLEVEASCTSKIVDTEHYSA